MSTDNEDSMNELETTPANLFNDKRSDGMEVTAILCNNAEVSNGLIYMLGGGINRVTIRENAPEPWTINLGIGLIIDIPWTETNKEHKVTIELIDDDSREIMVLGPEGPVPLYAEVGFNVGRPHDVGAGTVQNVTMAFNFPGLPLPKLGVYIFSIEIDEIERKRLVFLVKK